MTAVLYMDGGGQWEMADSLAAWDLDEPPTIARAYWREERRLWRSNYLREREGLEAAGTISSLRLFAETVVSVNAKPGADIERSRRLACLANEARGLLAEIKGEAQ